MKKATLIMMGMAGIGLTTYMVMNKKARKKATKILNNMLDETGNMMGKN